MKAVVLSSLLVLTVTTAQAGEFGVGIGALYAPTPYRDTDPTRLVIPVVNYEGENFYWRGIRGGWKFIEDRQQKLEAFVVGYSARFDPKDSGELRELNERKFAVMAGLGYSRNYEWGSVSAEVAHDISGHSDGSAVELAYSHPYFAADYSWMVSPQLGVAVFDNQYVDYYAGVSAAESARSGIEQYDGKATANPFVAVAGFYRFTKEWQFAAYLRGGWQGDGFSDSPMIDSEFVPSGFVALTYQF